MIGRVTTVCQSFWRQLIFLILLPSLRHLWSGWTVAWATHGIADYARYLGWDVAAVLDGEYAAGFHPPTTAAEFRADEDSDYQTTVVTVRWEDGRIGDYVFVYLPGSVLDAGPPLLDYLREKGPDALPRESGDEGQEGGRLPPLVKLLLSVICSVFYGPRDGTR